MTIKEARAARDAALEAGDHPEFIRLHKLVLALSGRDDTRLEAEKYDFDAEDAKIQGKSIMNDIILSQLKARARELTAELVRIEKAIAALTIDTSEKAKGAKKRGRPKKAEPASAGAEETEPKAAE